MGLCELAYPFFLRKELAYLFRLSFVKAWRSSSARLLCPAAWLALKAVDKKDKETSSWNVQMKVMCVANDIL